MLKLAGFLDQKELILVKVTLLTAAILIGKSTCLKTGKCDECLAENGVACLSESSFAICYEDDMTDNRTPCPVGTFCTEDENICRSEAEGFRPICFEDQCGNCEYTNGRFACLSETSYAFCYGGSTPDADSVRFCPGGYVCSHESTQICVSTGASAPSCVPPFDPGTTISHLESTLPGAVDSTTTGTDTDTETSTFAAPSSTPEDSTTPSVIVTTTTITTTQMKTTSTEKSTTIQPRDPNTLCADMQREGYFRPDNDVTCKEYIYCFMLSNQWLGNIYYCRDYFNSETGKCQAERPNNC